MSPLSPEVIIKDIGVTPYGLDLNETTRPKLQALIDRGTDITNTYEAVRERLTTVIRSDPEFRAFQTYQSNQLELQGPTLPVTESILKRLAEAPEPDDLWDYSDTDFLREFLAMKIVNSDAHLIDVLGQHQANLLVERIGADLRGDRPFIEADLRALNRFCIQNKLHAGEYRKHDMVNIGQFYDDDDPMWFSRKLDHQVEVRFSDIPSQMQALCEFITRQHSYPALSAAVAHAWFTHVHPFEDGNGRVARLIANLVLLRNGWPPITIPKSRRDEYLDALSHSDEAGDISLLLEVFVDEIENTLKELSDERYWLKRYRLELRTSPERRQVEWIDAARNFIGTLRDVLQPLGYSVERLSMPDIPTFTLLEDGEARAATLFAKIRHRDRREVRVGLGFMSDKFRAMPSADPTSDGFHYPPTVYFQERNFEQGAPFPYVHRSESMISIREFSFFPGRKHETLALVGRRDPTGIPMTHAELAQSIARELDELNFRGLS